MASIQRNAEKSQNWHCAYYDREGFRCQRSTGTSHELIAKRICSTVEDLSDLARKGKLSNEKALKTIREACAAIEERRGKLQADRAHEILRGYAEEFIKIAGGELESYTVKSWLDSWIK